MGCCGPKVSNISVIADVISPSRHKQISSQYVRGCATRDGAIYSEKEILSHIMGTAPIVALARTYGLHPHLWLLPRFNVYTHVETESASIVQIERSRIKCKVLATPPVVKPLH